LTGHMLVPVARILFSLRTVARRVVSERALRPALVVFIAVRIVLSRRSALLLARCRQHAIVPAYSALRRGLRKILPEKYLVADLPTKERLGLLAPPNTAQTADDAQRAWLDPHHHTTPAVALRDSRVLHYELS